MGNKENFVYMWIQKIVNPEVYKTIDSIETSYGKHDNGEQVLFSHDSYFDEEYYDRSTILFPGHADLIFHNSFKLDSLSRCNEEDFDYVVNGDEAEKMLRDKSGCTMFGGDYTFYGTIEKDGVPVWSKITPEYSISFSRRPDECGGYDGYRLKLSIGTKENTAHPLLLSAVKRGCQFKPKGNVYRLTGMVDSSTVPANDTTAYILITTYPLPQHQKMIKTLWSEENFIQNYDDELKRVIHMTSHLLVKWSDNTVDTITGTGPSTQNIYVRGEISEVVMLDVNGDDLPDIYFSTEKNEKWIGIMNANRTFTVICIKHAREEGRC